MRESYGQVPVNAVTVHVEFQFSDYPTTRLVSNLCASLSSMKTKWSWFLILLASVSFIRLDAVGSSAEVPSKLIGTWDYTSMTTLKKGKPLGTVHFQPGQWTVTFNQNATWTMKLPSPANPRDLNGSYEVHDHDLDMKLTDGKPFHKYRFTVESDGKVLALASDEATISAKRE